MKDVVEKTQFEVRMIRGRQEVMIDCLATGDGVVHAISALGGS